VNIIQRQQEGQVPAARRPAAAPATENDRRPGRNATVAPTPTVGFSPVWCGTGQSAAAS
jgi:hypothetical protein